MIKIQLYSAQKLGFNTEFVEGFYFRHTLKDNKFRHFIKEDKEKETAMLCEIDPKTLVKTKEITVVEPN